MVPSEGGKESGNENETYDQPQHQKSNSEGNSFEVHEKERYLHLALMSL
jgi:hypothetical protein